MMKKFRILVIAAAFSIVTHSCRKDRPDDQLNPPITVGTSGGVYITNEGNFQFGNATVSYYNIADSTVAEDIYEAANNNPLGDVCQSMYLFNGKAYIVVNNSGKVAVVNAVTFTEEATISGLASPRYFLPASNSKAYITDLTSNTVSVVNLNDNTVSGSIAIPGWTEEMATVYGKVFVTNEKSDKVYVINSASDLVEDSIQIGYSSNSIKEDKNGKLWVLCAGSETDAVYASLHRINPVTNQVEQSFQFPNHSDVPWKLDINQHNDTLYFINGSVFQMPVTAATLPATAFIEQGSHNFYGVGIDPNSGEIYVSDAIDYVQRGVVYRYKSDGTLLGSFQAGIIPGEFYFN